MSEADKEKAQKPSGNLEGIKVAQGQEKAPKEGEVGGHMSTGEWYICWHCGARNWAPYGWNYLYCWNCGALNRV